MSLLDIQKERNIKLPTDYVKFVSALSKGAEYLFNEEADGDPEDGSCWSFFSVKALSKVAKMKDVGDAPTHKALTLYLQCYQEFTKSKTVQAFNPKGKIKIERVANGFVIAESDCGDLLYLDPADKFSVWIYFHDGSFVQRVAASFKAWLKRAIKD
jgi:hypothetical protein